MTNLLKFSVSAVLLLLFSCGGSDNVISIDSALVRSANATLEESYAQLRVDQITPWGYLQRDVHCAWHHAPTMQIWGWGEGGGWVVPPIPNECTGGENAIFEALLAIFLLISDTKDGNDPAIKTQI